MKTNSYFSGKPLEQTVHVCSDKPEIEVGRCPETGLLELFSFDHIDDNYYATNYVDEKYPPEVRLAERERQSEWNHKRVEYLQRLLGAGQSTKILDYGAGTGGFLEASQGHFEDVIGYDISESSSEANREIGLDCRSLIADIPSDREVITLFHVLEHLKKPWEFLGELPEKFPQLRYVVAEVPNTGEALNTTYDCAPYRRNHFNSLHLYYFTNCTLSAVFDRAGLEVQESTQLQRYPLANHLGWLADGRGGGQDRLPDLATRATSLPYEQALVDAGTADSVFLVGRIDR